MTPPLAPKHKRFETVCFDCDSTLTRIEGIDDLAVRAGIADQIVPLTMAAMDGRMTVDAVYGLRLQLIRPDREAIAWLGQRYVDELVPGARETVGSLQRAGVAVHIVSGGLRQPILVLADALGVPDACVHAVDVHFDRAGGYAGFDTASPLARSGGKALVCRAISAGGASLAMVGDGVTDLEARDAGAFIVGFGGVIARPVVVAGADVFIPGPVLTDTLAVLLN